MPYACNYVRQDDTSQPQTDDSTSSEHAQSLIDVRDLPKDASSAASLLHRPSIPWETHVPSELHQGELKSPAKELYDTPHRQQPGSDIAKAEYFPDQVQNDKSSYKWVLTPRRDHAALNSGTKSLAEESKVILVAWPVEVHDVEGNKIGAGTLTQKEKHELEDGFRSLVKPDDKAGIFCVPVWMEDDVSRSYPSFFQSLRLYITIY